MDISDSSCNLYDEGELHAADMDQASTSTSTGQPEERATTFATVHPAPSHPIGDTVTSALFMARQRDISNVAGPSRQMDDGNIPSTSQARVSGVAGRPDELCAGDASPSVVPERASTDQGYVLDLSISDMRTELADMNLNEDGSRDVLRARLLNSYRQQQLPSSVMDLVSSQFLVLLAIAFNFDQFNAEFESEVVEISAVVLDVKNKKINKLFQEFCKPVVKPLLTEDCIKETGVHQEHVDGASLFPEVLERFQEALEWRGLGIPGGHSFSVVSEGPWNIVHFIKQLQLCHLHIPTWIYQWVDLGKAFSMFYGTERMYLHEMLENIGVHVDIMPPNSEHDAMHAAALVCQMLEDGCPLRVNAFLMVDHGRYLRRAARDEVSSDGSPKASGCGDDGQASSSVHYPQPPPPAAPRYRHADSVPGPSIERAPRVSRSAVDQDDIFAAIVIPSRYPAQN